MVDLYGFLMRNRIIFLNQRIGDQAATQVDFVQGMQGWGGVGGWVGRRRPPCRHVPLDAASPSDTAPLPSYFPPQLVASLLARDSLPTDVGLSTFTGCRWWPACWRSTPWTRMKRSSCTSTALRYVPSTFYFLSLMRVLLSGPEPYISCPAVSLLLSVLLCLLL